MCDLCLSIVRETENLNLIVCLSSPEPVNRATAAREFRVFHAALHSLNSSYRDSVSRKHSVQQVRDDSEPLWEIFSLQSSREFR